MGAMVSSSTNGSRNLHYLGHKNSLLSARHLASWPFCLESVAVSIIAPTKKRKEKNEEN